MTCILDEQVLYLELDFMNYDNLDKCILRVLSEK